MTKEATNKSKTIPFLRWAGGKKWLIKDLEKFLPKEGFNNFHEPFLGGGAIFFHLTPKKAFLNDLNKELIDTYEQIQADVEGVISELRKFQNTEDFYYSIRQKRFRNKNRKAAQFIYLNQTSFNGIYRVNLKGEYNVPFGHRKKEFLDEENLRAASKALKGVKFSRGDFSYCISNIKKGDLVFIDPPYTITHNDNGFFKYNRRLFSESDQHRLSKFIDQIKERGAYYILTNAAHLEVKKIFDKEDQVVKLKRASLIGGKNAKRDKYAEYIFTNCK